MLSINPNLVSIFSEPGKKYHDGSKATIVLQDGKCPSPLEGACNSRSTQKTAYIEGPIDCGDQGWYCRIMPAAPEDNWPPLALAGDVNFGHCNSTDAFDDAGFDRDGHCHGSDKDNTYYWWVRDHWHRQYNGHLRCCCGWAEDTSDTPMFAGRIGNRCDFRRQVTQDEDLSKCRDANEEDVDNLPHGLSYEGGCNPQYENQIGSPIPEDDSMCWEVRYFGEAGDDDDDEEENDDGDNEGPECEGLKKQKCKKMNECTWNAKEKVCVEACDGEDCNNEEDSEDEEGPECEGMKKQKCKKMNECTWDAKEKVCVEACDGEDCDNEEEPSPECEGMKKWKCNKVDECTWDSNEEVCVEACDGEDCNNEEDSEDEEGCEAIKRQKDCKKNPECKWNKSKKVCKESPSNKCEKIKKKNCKKNSACRWDKNENSCVEKGQANRKLLRGA